MGYTSGSKPGSRKGSDSDTEDEVNRDPESLRKENAELNDLLDKCDEKLRKAKKNRKEHRKLLDEYAKKIGELESKLLDATLEIKSLKTALVVTDEIECTDCDVFLADLTMLREKYASRVEELDLVKVELDELKSRPTLLGACTSCPVLHDKLNESVAHAKSLESALKILCCYYLLYL